MMRLTLMAGVAGLLALAACGGNGVTREMVSPELLWSTGILR